MTYRPEYLEQVEAWNLVEGDEFHLRYGLGVYTRAADVWVVINGVPYEHNRLVVRRVKEKVGVPWISPKKLSTWLRGFWPVRKRTTSRL